MPDPNPGSITFDPMTLDELEEWWRKFAWRWHDVLSVIAESPDRRQKRHSNEGFNAHRMRCIEDALADQYYLILAEYLMLRERLKNKDCGNG